MKIAKTFRTPYMAIDLCKDEDRKIWVILCSKCTGQMEFKYETWNEAQKQLSKLLWLTNAVEAPRKSPA